MARKKAVDELSQQDKSYIKTVHANKDLSWDQRLSMLILKFNKSERTIRRWIRDLGYSEYKEVENSEIRQGLNRKYDLSKKYFFITWAQNATPVHIPLWENILIYAELLNADIGVIQGRYQNPTSLWTLNMQGDEWWDKVTQPYWDAARHHIHEYLTIASDVKIVPTASDPLTGFEGLTGESSCILGHPRVHMKCLPTLEGHNKKMLFTTGACTLKNYTDTKAGKKGEFHHTYGFVIVEIEDDLTCHIRQVTAEQDGSFTDLWFHVDKTVTKINSCEGYIAGDIHANQCHHPVMEKTIELFNVLKPKRFVAHDLFNGKSISHHDAKDPVKLYQKFEQGLDKIKVEVEGVYEFIDRYSITKYDPIVVRSNHDEWIDRWIRNTDWKDDIANAKEYIEYTLATLNGDAPKGVFPYLLEKKYGDKITTLDFDDSFKIKGWEIGQHGHLGANGSKGNITQFAKLNTKMIVADAHCVPLEYQVQFLDRGWGEIKTVKPGDLILSYDHITKSNVWVNVDEYIEFDYSGIMLKIEGNGFEQTFTSEHMLMLKDGSYLPATQAICTRSASELPLSAKAVDRGINVPINIIRQIVAIAADGSIEVENNKFSKYVGRIRFDLKKERKIERLNELFGDDLVAYNKVSREGFSGRILASSETVSEIMVYKPNLFKNKRISSEVLLWDADSLEILQDELSYWDGSFGLEHNGRQWGTTSKKEANVISSILTRLGYSSRVNKRLSENPNHKILYIITWCIDRDFNRSTQKANHESRFNSWGFTSYNTDSVKVGCVRVKNKCFWIRSDKTGQVSLTGNSPGRKDGVIQVGTYTVLRMGFNRGPSSWAHCGAIIHHSGKAQQIIFQENNNFTTLWSML